jgi:hypothetical protein
MERAVQAERAVLRALIEIIEATGGLVTNEENILVPAADEEWPDLAAVYLQACDALGRRPMRSDQIDPWCNHDGTPPGYPEVAMCECGAIRHPVSDRWLGGPEDMKE